jgi:tRNA dimethylallyltransferase
MKRGDEPKPKIIVVVGSTATGKSDMAVSIARKVDGEIISADSRQVYRGLDIGTGKITKKEMKGVPHHMLDIAEARQQFSVERHVKKARSVIKQIIERGKVPIIVGGTGFYIDTLVEGLEIPKVKKNTLLRKSLSKKSNTELFTILKKLDPVRASTIDKNNPVRLIRAIEIATEFGSVPPIRKNSSYDALWIGIDVPVAELKERILNRLLKRIRMGMVKEAKDLNKKGLSFKRMEELGLEYRYLARLLKAEINKEGFKEQLFSEIVKYAKRQKTWFKRNKSINWLSPAEHTKAVSLSEEFVRN